MESAEIGAVAANLSFVDLIQQAHWVVQAVMAILVFMSIWSWAIAFEKSLSLRGLHSRANQFEREFWSGRSLDSLADEYAKAPRDPFSKVFAAGLREWKGANSGGRVLKAAGAEASREMNKAEGGLGVLATIASAAPFIGLFGTVWGIMNSFISIGATGQPSLAVVAPGIAEALFATALGLLAAVPAVIFFNALSANLAKYGSKLDAFVDELSALADREE